MINPFVQKNVITIVTCGWLSQYHGYLGLLWQQTDTSGGGNRSDDLTEVIFEY